MRGLNKLKRLLAFLSFFLIIGGCFSYGLNTHTVNAHTVNTHSVNAHSVNSHSLPPFSCSNDIKLTPGYTNPKEPVHLNLDRFKNKNLAVYYVPHADDEVLAYGVPILNDLRAGKEVVLVLLSHGDTSSAFKKINQKINPDLSRIEFGFARVKEFQCSCDQLGIPKENRLVFNLKGGHYDPEFIKQIALQFERISPNVVHKGMSEKDILSDHAITGKVLNELKAQGKIKHVVTYASLYMSRIHIPRLTGTKITLSHPEDAKIIDKAAEAYSRWDPKHGWYSVGRISVGNQFKSLIHDKYSIQTKK